MIFPSRELGKLPQGDVNTKLAQLIMLWLWIAQIKKLWRQYLFYVIEKWTVSLVIQTRNLVIASPAVKPLDHGDRDWYKEE